MPVTLKPDEQELLREEIAAFSAATSDPQSREEYDPLLAAVESGDVPDEGLALLGEVLEVGLQTGRIRKIHRALGEQTLLRVFHKTPAGEAHTERLGHLNKALAQLEGQAVETVRVLERVPGTYLIMISTDDCEMTLRFSPDGAEVESVAVGV